jgi:hypothetical protein
MQNASAIDGIVAGLAPALEEKQRNDHWPIVKFAGAIGR